MLENRSYLRPRIVMIALLLLFSGGSAFAQTPSFTYQGRLTDSGTPASGNYDVQFTLWDSLSGGTQIGTTQTQNAVSVSAGIFTVQLNFGATAFPGADRFLEISARPSGVGSFTILAPRQPITSTPYAIRSLNASSADTVTVSGVPAGSGNYIQNTTSPQSSSNFNISGNGTAGGTLSGNVVNAGVQYDIGGNRVLSTPGSQNLFAGVGAGQTNTAGFNNTFVGFEAGSSNATAAGNAIFGANAGRNVNGNDNTFFGTQAGFNNTTGNENTMFGFIADVGANNLTNATAIGARAFVTQSNSLVLGSINGVNFATADTNVGIGTTTPQNTLHVKGGVLVETSGSGGNIQFGTPNSETGMTVVKGTSSRADLRFDGAILKLVVNAGNPVGIPPPTNGIAITTAGSVGIGTTSPFLTTKLDIVGGFLRLDQLAGGGDENLCRNSSVHTIATCSSSSRYKEQLAPYTAGLDLINRLHPISFAWKANGTRDLGLGAEDVAKVEPLLVTRNEKGEVEGVKYDHLNVVLINAIKEQQNQIEQQQKQIATLMTSNAALNARLRGVEKSLRKKAGSAKRRH